MFVSLSSLHDLDNESIESPSSVSQNFFVDSICLLLRLLTLDRVYGNSLHLTSEFIIHTERIFVCDSLLDRLGSRSFLDFRLRFGSQN